MTGGNERAKEGDTEQLTPLGRDVRDMIRSVVDEMIDEAEDERAAHAAGHDPAAELRPPPPKAQPGERASQDDDVDEECTAEREWNARTGVRAAMSDIDREVHKNDRGQRQSSRHIS